nr:hypothetical protein [Tanacetum cinerariifolium]
KVLIKVLILPDVDELKDMVKALLLEMKGQNQSHAPVKAVDASTLSSGTLPSNPIANPRSDLKAITTRSEATKYTMNPTNNGSTKDVQPQVVQSKSTSEPATSSISKPVIASVNAPKPNPNTSIPYPSRRNDERIKEK